jgi:hypothetical protein
LGQGNHEPESLREQVLRAPGRGGGNAGFVAPLLGLSIDRYFIIQKHSAYVENAKLLWKNQ